MSIFSTVRGWIVTLLRRSKEELGVAPVSSKTMAAFIKNCAEIYSGQPPWMDDDNHIKTINFAKSVCSETARLTTLDISITVSGSVRAEWLQEEISGIYPQLRRWVEYGCGYGTVIFKPRGGETEVVFPSSFEITEVKGDEVTGCVFESREYDTARGRWYTRLEYHRFLDNGNYAITNRCYEGKTEQDYGKPVPIETTPWAGLLEDVELENIEHPLFSVFRMPEANNIDPRSPLGMPIFSDAIEELKDLDIAYSRNAKEIFDSKRTVLLDSDRLTPGTLITGVDKKKRGASAIKDAGLPDYVRLIEGNGQDDYYHEINPSLETGTRLDGINALLSQIGYKCGYSNGYFVFNEQGGLMTATQVESDDRRTVQTIKDIRDKLQSCMDALIYALDKFADLFGYAPKGVYEVTYDFGDPTYSFEEDKQTWWGYVLQGKVPPYLYFMKFEGMSEDDARAMVAEAQQAEPLYGMEE